MRISSLKVVFFAVLMIVLPSMIIAAPQVTFDPSSLTLTPGASTATPPIVIENAAGVTSATLHITVPSDITVDAVGNIINGVTQGSSAGQLFFAEWNSTTRTISITCTVNSADTLEIVKSIAFTAPASVTTEEFGISGSLTGGSGSPTFTPLTVLPPHTVSFTSRPAVSSSTVDSAGSTNCSATAVDSHGHSMTYAWSDGGKGGSFTPSAASQNPTYKAAANTTGSNVSVTLTCTATCTQDTSIKATDQVSLTVRYKLTGDVSKDGHVDKTDADLVLQYLFGDIAKTAEMDANSDGSVTIADAQWILAHPQSGS